MSQFEVALMLIYLLFAEMSTKYIHQPQKIVYFV